MYNHPNSKRRQQQELSMDSLNLKEKQLLQNSSTINPLAGSLLSTNQYYSQMQLKNSNFDKNNSISINPITGDPLVRNTYNNPQETRQQKITPYGVQQNTNSYTTSSGIIGSGANENDVKFQKNLNKFFAADDPNQIKQKSHLKSNNAIQQDPQFQQNLAADNPSQPHKNNGITWSPKHYRFQETRNQQDQETRNQQDQQTKLRNFNNQDEIKSQESLILFSPNQSQIVKTEDQTDKFQFQELEQDPQFQKNMLRFFGVDIQDKKLPPNINKQQKIIAIIDSSSTTRNHIVKFFKERGIDEFDACTNPGGVFGLIKSTIFQQSLQHYIITLSERYTIKEIYIISVLDNNSNVQIYTSINDRGSNKIAILKLKSVMEKQLNLHFKLNGIIIDQRGVSEKVF